MALRAFSPPAGLHAMAALDAGAHHVTAVERWLYLSLTCKETLKLNSFGEDRFKVIYKRPTDLRLQTDVPILCNLLLCDILDEGKNHMHSPTLVPCLLVTLCLAAVAQQCTARGDMQLC